MSLKYLTSFAYDNSLSSYDYYFLCFFIFEKKKNSLWFTGHHIQMLGEYEFSPFTFEHESIISKRQIMMLLMSFRT